MAPHLSFNMHHDWCFKFATKIVVNTFFNNEQKKKKKKKKMALVRKGTVTGFKKRQRSK